MMDFLKWMFGSFWRFLGVIVLASVLLEGGSSLLLAIRGKTDPTDCPATITLGGGDSGLSMNMTSTDQ